MNNGNPANITTDDSPSIKHQSSFFKPLRAADNGVFKDVKIAVLLKYLSIIWRSLEMPIINCKIHLELNWTKDCVSPKLYVLIVTLSSKDNIKTINYQKKDLKLLEKGFKRHIQWNEYQTKIETRDLDNKNLTRFPLDVSFKGVRGLFVLAFDNTDNGAKKVEKKSHAKHFPSRVDTTNYNVLTDGRNVYDQSINDQIKQYDQIRKTATGDGYTTGCLLDYQYFKSNYQLIAVDLNKQSELDADSRLIKQIQFYGMLKFNSVLCTVLQKSKETML